ncbi:hypothetical protein [Halorussus salinus]|uniref:hypothetical protein n=1 Tax=Halorussus salinus TaxID=1364935 RepID=UPI001092EF53|nr:hypothetical protein [Halorussus salinus]
MLSSPKRLALEALPVAGILLFWNLLAGIAHFQNVGGSVGSAGVVMAALYVVVRGVALASDVLPPATDNVATILYQNALLALPAGAWFVAAMVVGAVEAYVYEFTWVLASVKTALGGAGLGVVGLYAVAAGHRELVGEEPTGGRPSPDREGADGESRSGGSSADD